MNRRETVFTLLAVGASSLPCFAQRAGQIYRLGILGTADRSDWRNEPYTSAFLQRLRELGFVEGLNLVIERRDSEGNAEKLPGLAAELARQNCDVLVGTGAESVLVALKQATRDTPIVVWANDYDPVATGHIASFARPGGRITGVSLLQAELPAKRVELLKELLPHAKRIAVFSDSASTGQLNVAQAAAKQLGLNLEVFEFKRQPYDYEKAFAGAVRVKAEALLQLGSTFFVPARQLIPALALKYRLPSMFHHSAWAEAGGLLSYGPNFSNSNRRVAEYVGMILNGRKPADLPVEQPTTFELVVNAKTAKALGITIPGLILLRADRLIE